MMPANKQQRLFNSAVLEDLELQVGNESMTQVLTLLLNDLRGCAETLAACLDTGDEARARRTGHKLKGMIEQYGVRDPDGCATKLASRYDLYWLTEATALFSLCQLAMDELRKIQQARSVSNDELGPDGLRNIS